MNMIIGITPAHVDYLGRQVRKILYLFDENNQGLPIYTHSLIYELYGLRGLIDENKRPQLDSIISILSHLHEDVCRESISLELVRREVFHCSDIIKKLFKVDK